MADPELQNVFTTYKQLRVGMMTWNLGGNPPPESFYLYEHILPRKKTEEETKD